MSKTDTLNEIHSAIIERGGRVVIHGTVTGRFNSRQFEEQPRKALLLDTDSGKSLLNVDYKPLEERVLSWYDSNPNADVIVIDSFAAMADMYRIAQEDADAYRWLSMSRDEMDADAFKKQYLCEWKLPEVDAWHKKHGTQNKSLHVERERVKVDPYKTTSRDRPNVREQTYPRKGQRRY